MVKTTQEKIKMFYIDYSWDITENGILFDENFALLNSRHRGKSSLPFADGDQFVITTVNDRVVLRKIKNGTSTTNQ